MIVINKYNSKSPFEIPLLHIRLIPLIFISLLMLRPANNSFADPLREYYVTCNQAEFDSIITNYNEEIYIDCEFEFEGQLYPNAIIKIRGESSRGYYKKSFKINFKKEYRFQNRDKINLISEYTDPSFMREYLAYDLYRRIGYSAAIAQYAKFYVNGNYMGLYLDVENMDEFFLDRIGLSEEGSLYKADAEGAALQYGINYESYYEKKTNESSGFDDLIHLIETVHFVSDEDFYNEMDKIVDLSRLYEFIALNILLANGSTYYHNYYCYHHPAKNIKWIFYPWDMDKAYTYYGSEFQYYNAGYWVLNSFIKKVWLNAFMRRKIGEKVEYLIENYFIQQYYDTIIDSLISTIGNAVDKDTYKRYTYSQFIAEAANSKKYISDRIEYVLKIKNHAPYPFVLNAAQSNTNFMELSWQNSTDPDNDNVSYILQVSSHSYFIDSLTYEYQNITQNSYTVAGLAAGKYYWRVFACDGQLQTKCLDRLQMYNLEVDREWGGTLTKDTTWDWRNSPYILTADIIVPHGVRLDIEEDVTVLLNDSTSIIIYGELNALGSKEKPIIFKQNNNSAWGSLIFLNTQRQSIITNSQFQYSCGKVIPDEKIDVPATIALYNASLIIDSCQFSQNKCNSIDATKSTILVKNCWIYDNEGEGVHGTYAECLLYNNVIHGLPAGYDGIDLDFKASNNFRSEICDNIIFDIQDDAVDLNNTDALIVNNRIFNCKDKGISVGESAAPLIKNNLIYNNTIGIAIKDNSNPYIINNTLYNDLVGIKSYIKYGPSGGIGTVLNTIIWNCDDGDIILLDDSEITVEYSDIESGWPGTGNISANPLFVDPVNNNFQLSAGSPAIDSGHPSSEYWDKDSTRNDMGVFGGPDGLMDSAIFVNYEDPLPTKFELYQNYPNPFNQNTVIRYNLKQSGHLKLTIYDMLGRQVKVLVDKLENKNSHTVLFDASSLTSGIYFYRLEFKGKVISTQIKKMVLLK